MPRNPQHGPLQLALTLTLAMGCAREPAPPRPSDGPAPATGAASGTPSASRAQLPLPSSTAEASSVAAASADGAMIAIPAGIYRAGSRPGTPGRRPRLEADLVASEVAAYSIDRLPYPNDPSRAPRVDVTRDEAAGLCAAEGKRLCTELEWERACVGTGRGPFTTGETLELETCGGTPTRCGSDEGVLGMGVLVEEWTASAVSRGLGSEQRSVVVRGAGPDGTDRRCAARDSAAPGQASNARGFRCCAGATPNEGYPDEPARARLRDAPMDDAEARRILASLPEVARFAEGFQLFGRDQALAALARGGKTVEDLHGWELMEGVLRWAPVPGEELWILAGASGDSSLLVAVYPLPDGTFLHAASFVLDGERAPIALAHTLASPGELLWSSCWGCRGEGGAVEYRDDATVVISQR